MGMSTLLRMIFGFLSVTIAARVIPEEDFGVYYLLLAIVYLLKVLGGAGLQVSAAKFIASAESIDRQQIIVNNLLTFRLMTVLIVSVLAFLGKPLLLFFFSSELLSTIFFFAPIIFAIELSEETLSYIMQGFQLYNKMASAQIIAGILKFLIISLFLITTKLSVENFIIASLVSLSFTIVLELWMIPTPKAFAFDQGLIRQFIRFGLPLQGNDILSYIFSKVDVLILGSLMGPIHVAYLEIAAKIPNYFRSFFYSFETVYFPHMAGLFAQRRRHQAENLLNNFLRLASFLTIFFTLILVLFQQELIVLIFSDRYLPSASALGLLMASVAIGVVSTILDKALISAGYPAYLIVINLVTTIASLLGNITLIPLFGFMGAVYAKLIANTVANPVSVYCLRREKINVSMFKYILPAIFLALCLAIYYVLGWQTIFAKGIIISLFLGLSMSFSLFTIQDIQTLIGSFLPKAQKVITE